MNRQILYEINISIGTKGNITIIHIDKNSSASDCAYGNQSVQTRGESKRFPCNDVSIQGKIATMIKNNDAVSCITCSKGANRNSTLSRF